MRRDYPPKKIRVNPKPDVSKKLIWSPRLTFLAGVIFVVLMILAYLGFQYARFISSPKLEVFRPSDGEIVSTEVVKVVGLTDKDTAVFVNNQPALISGDGSFEVEIAVSPNTKELVIKAKSRSGKITEVVQSISVVLDE